MVLTKMCSAGPGGSSTRGERGTGSMGRTACSSAMLRLWLAAYPGVATDDTARKDKRRWAVTRTAEVQLGLSFFRLENMVLHPVVLVKESISQ
jgi:hypothetical protein